jgi:hypothetical protein
MNKYEASKNCITRNSAPSIIGMVKSSRIRLAGHVARVEEKINAYRFMMN